MNLKQPTKKQNDVLEFIKAHKRVNGTLPTYSEIMMHFGFKSPNSVTQNLSALQEKGLLLKDGDGYLLPDNEPYFEPAITLKQASEYLDMAEGTLRNKAYKGEIPYYKPSGKMYFFKSELYRWIKGNTDE